MKVKPLRGLVVVKLLREERIWSNIIIKETNPWLRGLVLGVGADVRNIYIGNIIMFQPTKSKVGVFTLDGELCMCMSDEQIFCVQDAKGRVVRVLKDYVLLESLGDGLRLCLRVLLPQRRHMTTKRAKVLRCGPESYELVVGDIVLCPAVQYREYRYKGKYLFFTKYANLLAVECGE